jgi:hypothetical protein
VRRTVAGARCAAGEAVQLSGAETLLIDRIDAEYLRYYTPTGRPTGEWAAAIRRLREADDEVARCAAAVAEVDDAVRRHAALTDDLSRLAEERADAAKRLTEARAAAEAVAALTQQLKQAEVVAGAADATHAATVAALTERRRLRADIDQRTAAIAELEAAAAEALDELTTAAEVQEAAEAAAEEARAAVEASQARVDAARRVVERASDRDEANRLETRLGKLGAAGRELESVDRELAGIMMTDDTMRAIETAAIAVERAAGQAELASAHIDWSRSPTSSARRTVNRSRMEAARPGRPASARRRTSTCRRADRARWCRRAGVGHAGQTRAAQKVLGGWLRHGSPMSPSSALATSASRVECAPATSSAAIAMVSIGDDDVECTRATVRRASRGMWTRRAVDPAAARAELDAARGAHQAGHRGLRDASQGGRGRGEDDGGTGRLAQRSPARS